MDEIQRNTTHLGLLQAFYTLKITSILSKKEIRLRVTLQLSHTTQLFRCHRIGKPPVNGFRRIRKHAKVNKIIFNVMQQRIIPIRSLYKIAERLRIHHVKRIYISRFHLAFCCCKIAHRK